MGKYIRWQAIIAVSGIVLIVAFLGAQAFSQTTILIPDRGGVYIEGLAGSPHFLNPLLSQYNQIDQDICSLIFNGLTASDGKGGVTPSLASSWNLSADGMTYLFHLRKDVRWQDGVRFSADDVQFTISLMQDPAFPGAPYLKELWRTVRVEKVDASTIRFILQEPYPAFIDFTTIGILPEHLLKDAVVSELLSANFNLRPVGTGPFVLSNIDSQSARLTANPLYWSDRSMLNEIDFDFYPNHQGLITAYRSGEIDGISSVMPDDLPALMNDTSFNLYSTWYASTKLIYLNLNDFETNPFFKDAEARQALMYAIDRQALINGLMNGQAIIANSVILPWSWAYNPQVVQYTPDAAKASSLLEAAGWTDSDGDGVRDKKGVPFAFKLTVSDDPLDRGLADAIASQLKPLGIAVSVDVDQGLLVDKLRNKNFQAVLVDIQSPGDPDPYPQWHQAQIASGQNYSGWNDDEASKLLESARATIDPEARKQAYAEFQRIFAEQVPAILLFHPTYNYAVNNKVKNIQISPMSNPSERFRSISNWYINTRRVIIQEKSASPIAVPTP